MKLFGYNILPSGEVERTVAETPDDDTPQKKRVNALAAAQPGRVAVGIAFQSPETSYEHEDYLDQLGKRPA